MKLVPVAALSMGILFVACQKPQPLPLPVDSAASTAPHGVSVHTVLTIARDSSAQPRDTTHVFGTRDTIHGVIHTKHARNGTTLIGRWYFLANGQKVAENSTRLSGGPNVSYFDLMNETPWPQGKYKLLVFIDAAPMDSTVFSIVNNK